MKIRSGFISNSSSTSYVIRGETLDGVKDIIKCFEGETGEYSIRTSETLNEGMYDWLETNPLEQAVIISEDYDYSISGKFTTFLYDNFDDINAIM